MCVCGKIQEVRLVKRGTILKGWECILFHFILFIFVCVFIFENLQHVCAGLCNLLHFYVSKSLDTFSHVSDQPLVSVSCDSQFFDTVNCSCIDFSVTSSHLASEVYGFLEIFVKRCLF